MASHQIQFRVDLERWKLISDAAKAEGMSMSDYARWCLVQHANNAAFEARLADSEATIIQSFKTDLKKVADYLAARLPAKS